MKKYRFEEFAINCTEKKVPTPEEYKTYIGLEHLDSKCLTVKRWGSDVPIIGEKLVMHKGDILLGKRNAYLRRAAIAPHDGVFSAHGMILRPKESVVDYKFFALFIASDYFFDEAIKISVGSLSPTINWKDLKNVEFLLPSLDEQRKIAKALWSINETIELYKEMIASSDELVNSRFDELFTKHSEIVNLQDYLWFQEGPGVRNYQYTDSGTKLINVTNLGKKHLELDKTSRYISNEEANGKYKHFLCQNNDVVVASSGINDSSISEKVSIVREEDLPLCMNTSVIRFRPLDSKKISTNYLYYFFKSNFYKEQVLKLMTGIAQLNYGPSHLKKIQFLLPQSVEEQDEFVKFADNIDQTKEHLNEGIKQLEALYKKIFVSYMNEGE